MCKITSMTKEVFLHKTFFDMTIRSTKTGNRTENRTPDQPEIFIDEPVGEYKFACIVIFSIGPSEVQKPETGQKTGPRTNRKFLWMNQYGNINLPALEFFR